MDRNRALSWRLAAAMGALFILLLALLFSGVAAFERAGAEREARMAERVR